MLAKKHRLNLRKNDAKIRSVGKKKHSSLFLLIHFDNDSFLQVGVKISKKVYKKAVDRNVLKRQIFSLVKQKLNLEQNLSLVIICKPAISKIPAKEWQDLLVAELNKIS